VDKDQYFYGAKGKFGTDYLRTFKCVKRYMLEPVVIYPYMEENLAIMLPINVALQ
jgi:hypothetical protein